MDITGLAQLAMASWHGRAGQELGMRMMRQAADQDAAVLQVVSAAAQGHPVPASSVSAGNPAGKILDTSA